MTTLQIEAEKDLITALEQTAKREAKPLESVIKEALRQYVQGDLPRPKAYSFIGIGHSGKGKISTQVEATLENAADRREGWSLQK